MGKLVIFGGSGGLGKPLSEKLKSDYDVVALSSKDVDVTDYNEVRDFFYNNDIIVDCIITKSAKQIIILKNLLFIANSLIIDSN